MDKLTKQLYIDKKTFVRIFKENWERYKKLCGCRKVEDENVQRLLKSSSPFGEELCLTKFEDIV